MYATDLFEITGGARYLDSTEEFDLFFAAGFKISDMVSLQISYQIIEKYTLNLSIYL